MGQSKQHNQITMAKTAEEILSEHLGLSVTESIPMWECAINASKEFAAQEVEAYKKRLKEAFVARYGNIGSSGAHETIDAVK